jgi:uncharacterized protein
MDSLSEHMVAFSRELRVAGLGTTPAASLDAARSLNLIGVGDLPAFRAALRANFTVSVDDFEAFDRAFDRYWLGRSLESVQPGNAPRATTIENRPQGPPVYVLLPAALEGVSPEGDARLPGGERTAGETDLLTKKDFRDVSTVDLPRLHRLIQQLAPRLATVPSRRTEPSHGGGRVDIRRTVRDARRHGGEVVALAWQRPKVRKLRVVALCDVSGSMDLYSQHLLQFFHALQLLSGGVRTFVFSTRLRDVSAVLRRRQIADVLAGLSARVETWSGGTTIGACLRDFNQRYAQELLGPRTVVLIASDGWERGDTELLRRELSHLRARARRVIWLNPLKARAGYEPLAAGMAAALPYVDEFLPAASVADLERLKRVLSHG